MSAENTGEQQDSIGRTCSDASKKFRQMGKLSARTGNKPIIDRQDYGPSVVVAEQPSQTTLLA